VALIIPKNVTKRLCDLYESQCISVALKNMEYVAENCKCYESCQTIIIDHEAVLDRMDDIVENVCYSEGEFGYDYVKNQLTKANINMTQTAMVENGLSSQIEHNLSLDHNNIISLCKYLGHKDFAFVYINMAKVSAMKIITNVRVTFSDKIATFGKLKRNLKVS
jgi:hypothetical protein